MITLQTHVLQLMMPGLNVLIQLYTLVICYLNMCMNLICLVLMILIINVTHFLFDFKYYSSHIRNVLFQRYCTSFYGTQMLPHFDTNIQDVYTAWRIAICRVWRLPWRTHTNMLAHIAGVMETELWFAKICISQCESTGVPRVSE